MSEEALCSFRDKALTVVVVNNCVENKSYTLKYILRRKHCLHQLWSRSLVTKRDTGGNQSCAQVFLFLGKEGKAAGF